MSDISDIYRRLRMHLANAHSELPDGKWHVALAAVLKGAKTKDGVLLITDDLEAVTPALADMLASPEGTLEVPE